MGKTVKAFRIISEFNLPFTTYNAFKSIGRDPKLLVNLILACWLNGASDVLIQEIDRFEDELNIAVHWIPHTVWGECIESFIRSLPPTLINIMNTKLGEITELINALSTLHYLQKLRLNLPNMLREGISEMPGFSQERT